MKHITITKDQQKKINEAVGMMRAIEGLTPLDIHNINEESTRILWEQVGYIYERSPFTVSKEELKPIPKKPKYIKLLKSGGYRAKDGTVKPPIFIKGLPYAPREDIEGECNN